jgi:hypothetical protein
MNILSVGGTMIYKVLSPIDIGFMWNLIYLCYLNFKELMFFKPVQNSQSREFYIIGKGYKGSGVGGVGDEMMSRLLEVIKKNEIESVDLFNGEYPEEFVYQVIEISSHLADNYAKSIERIIYYMDNMEEIKLDDVEFMKLSEKYIEEKNADWLKRYKFRNRIN